MITAAFTHWNRFSMLCEAMVPFFAHSMISEIVVSDDSSTDGSWTRLQEMLRGFSKASLYRNERNLDCYANKAKAVEHATSEWVILCDSDNTYSLDFITTIQKLAPHDPSVAYLPTFARPHFDYREFNGLIVDKSNVAAHMESVTFRTALNTANHFFFRQRYLDAFDPSVDPHTADSIYMNLRWLERGGRLMFVPGLHYNHRVHPGSHYQLNNKKTGDFIREVEARLRSLC